MSEQRERTRIESGRVTRAVRSKFGRRALEPRHAGPGVWSVVVDFGAGMVREFLARPGQGRVAFEGR